MVKGTVLRQRVSGLISLKYREETGNLRAFRLVLAPVAPSSSVNAPALQNLVRNSIDGSIQFICMDWRHMEEMLAAADGVYSELKNLIVWAKDNGHGNILPLTP
jgi:hypothetical protein